MNLNPFKGSRACLFAILVPVLLPQVLPEPLLWIWLTLACLWILVKLGIVKVAFAGSESVEPEEGGTSPDSRSSLKSGSPHRGEILALGSAPFEFDEANRLSYYITLRSATGERTLWGVDLERVAHEADLTIGETVELEFLGKKPVVVPKPVRDAQGKVVAHRKVNTHRNTWKATVLPA
ncbi:MULTISPECIES: hypothetical protein [unclassified Modicisalibacter]|uniref:hypothetical protein n=1 Tax=unclassified Modicisalibacter TaxID=2679913 RepID=UPI001CCE039A|nr:MULTISPECIES: hypothetical protein [unclassified Modicisalibacter]MBZ9559089.1 hypothetical protein [Modicisalibacter sp. R2A 31.J]MBZ9576800.1 hypothetical protein [Modicisalibacter sp. MOD 31.J]